MDMSSWLQLFVVCLLGAMSPGPSLGLVINNSLGGGRLFGILTSLGHGTGIALWAMLTAVGIAGFIATRHEMLVAMQASGACLLAYVGARTVLASDGLLGSGQLGIIPTPKVLLRGVAEGFLLSILNPKVALFFFAIFSHFVREGSSWTQTGLMGISAGLIDALWYMLVTVSITATNLTGVLRNRETAIRRVSGSLLLLIAVGLLISVSRPLMS
jgi:threonine/homoserine/homoserine lactone efflux protein